MRRRRYLGLVAGTPALAGCAARAFPGAEPPGTQDRPEACPAVLDVDRTICPGDDGPLAVEQSSESVTGDAWSLVVTVTNRSDEPVGVNPYAWSVSRRDDDRWRQVAPDAYIEPWRELAPDDRYVWQLTATAGGFDDADQRVLLELAPGTYAFAVPFQADEQVAVVVTFDVDG